MAPAQSCLRTHLGNIVDYKTLFVDMSTMLIIVIGTVTVASSHQPLASQIGGV